MFCHEVRESLSAARIEVQDRKLGKTRTSMVGGGVLSVDMSKAFDLVSRSCLTKALEFLGIEPDTISLVLSIHHTQYHIEHRGHRGQIALGNGIRQGCVLSPLLWVSVTHYMLHCLENKLAVFEGRTSAKAWIQEMQTLFADDFLSAFRLADSRDLGLMCARVGCLFEALREAGMQVNPEKSKLMLRAAGNTLTKWIRKHSFLHEGSKFIKFATPFSAVKIGLADSIEYLGACLSFQSFEKQTAQLRIKQARASVSRLCKVLFKKRGLSMNQRVKVYLTCIRSTALYSISAIGATEESLQLLSRMEAHHIRCIAGSARHITFESTADLYVRRADLCAAVSSPVSGA